VRALNSPFMVALLPLAMTLLLQHAPPITFGFMAYQGLWRELGDRVVVPRLTPRGQTKTRAHRLREQRLSGQRMPVEHAVGRLKWWRELRYWRRNADRFDQVGKAIAASQRRRVDR
jgi:hypothetical protein